MKEQAKEAARAASLLAEAQVGAAVVVAPVRREAQRGGTTHNHCSDACDNDQIGDHRTSTATGVPSFRPQIGCDDVEQSGETREVDRLQRTVQQLDTRRLELLDQWGDVQDHFNDPDDPADAEAQKHKTYLQYLESRSAVILTEYTMASAVAGTELGRWRSVR